VRPCNLSTINHDPTFRGTGSARAALVTSSGDILASHSQDTKTWRDSSDARIFEQSTADIFDAICTCVHRVMKDAGVKKEDVKGLGIDATCSLAVVDTHGEPVCVTRGEDLCGKPGERNVVLWADHRAEEDAALINKSESVVLDYVGGAMSVGVTIPGLELRSSSQPAGNGGPKDTLAQEAYARRIVWTLHVL
jgi:ribulose kinase